MDRRRFTLLVGLYAVGAAVSSGCSKQPASFPTPAGMSTGRPAFLYFYTEN